MGKKISGSQLKAFSPFDGLPVANLNGLVEETNVLDAQPGQELFKEGDSEKRAIYVFSGTVALLEGDHVVATITGETEEARNPLATILPRRYTALAKDAVEYISMDSDLLDAMLTLDQTGRYELRGLLNDSTDDWMTALLQSKVFHRILPANI